MQIADASPERIIEIAQFTARSRRSPTAQDYRKILDSTASYTNRVIASAKLLGFIEEDKNAGHRYVGPSELETSSIDGWPLLFRLRLQDFIPFMYFAFWISAGDSAVGAARKTCVEFEISNASESVRRTFYRWGSFSGILEGGNKTPTISSTQWTLATLGFVEKLRASLEEDFSAKLFTMSRLGADVVPELAQRSVPFSDVADSLRTFENDAEKAIDRSAQAVEALLASVLRDTSSKQRLPTGIGKLVEELKSGGEVTTRHVDVVKAIGGLRNATGHAVDLDTGRPWTMSVEAALASTMLSIITLRSIVKYRSNATQLL
ncbi:MAG: hypothetical protein OXG65_14655 [Chloroflexi bacterium]|nr:hypothetical protein [Chloroflexota bacterium]